MSASRPPEPKWRQHLSSVQWFLIDQWFLLALGCLVIIASQVQVPASRQSKKETVVTYLCVAIIFFVTGCTLPTRVLMQNYSRWKIHLFVQIQSFLMTSAVIYGVVSLCATNPNFMDPGLLAIGQAVQNIFPKPTKKVFIDFHLNKIGSLALLTIIWQTFDQAFQTGAFTSVKPDNIIFIVFISINYYILWTTICASLSVLRLGKEDTIAVAYCVPAKTPAMGVPLSNVMFAGLPAITASKIQIPMVVFQAFQIAGGSLMTIAFRRWIRPDEERGTDAAKAEHEGSVNASLEMGSE